jgi:hypothetical protein
MEMTQLIGTWVRTVMVAGMAVAWSAQASATQTTRFASCYGDHHGSYLNLWTVEGGEGLAQVNAVVTNDNDEQPARVYQIVELTKNSTPLPMKAWSWAIRQSIKADAAGEFYGFIFAKALGANGSTMYINLSKYTGSLRHALVIDGYVEELTCPVDRLKF